jgi:hypothetical protein
LPNHLKDLALNVGVVTDEEKRLSQNFGVRYFEIAAVINPAIRSHGVHHVLSERLGIAADGTDVVDLGKNQAF